MENTKLQRFKSNNYNFILNWKFYFGQKSQWPWKIGSRSNLIVPLERATLISYSSSLVTIGLSLTVKKL